MADRCSRCGNPNDVFEYCPAGQGGEPCVGARPKVAIAQGAKQLARQRIVGGLMDLERGVRIVRELGQGSVTASHDALVKIVERIVREKRQQASTLEDPADLRIVLDGIERMFGAPGDWGYETPIGSALHTIYGC